jgi:hypothetical protein
MSATERINAFLTEADKNNKNFVMGKLKEKVEDAILKPKMDKINDFLYYFEEDFPKYSPATDVNKVEDIMQKHLKTAIQNIMRDYYHQLNLSKLLK